MKREILFRGKRIDNGEWVEGYYHFALGKEARIYELGYVNFCPYELVHPETVGQFTGLTDKNGVKIFEGDVVRHTRYDGMETISSNHEVYFDIELLEFGIKQSTGLFNCQFSVEFEVIGKIYDNPELLEK